MTLTSENHSTRSGRRYLVSFPALVSSKGSFIGWASSAVPSVFSRGATTFHTSLSNAPPCSCSFLSAVFFSYIPVLRALIVSAPYYTASPACLNMSRRLQQEMDKKGSDFLPSGSHPQQGLLLVCVFFPPPPPPSALKTRTDQYFWVSEIFFFSFPLPR